MPAVEDDEVADLTHERARRQRVGRERSVDGPAIVSSIEGRIARRSLATQKAGA